MTKGTMKLDPRHQIVSKAELEIRAEVAATLNALSIDSWADILYHVAMIKVFLLGEMGATAEPGVQAEDVPDAHHCIAMAFYRYMIQYELTNAELYRIITEWELREAWGMVKTERNGDSGE